jgi:hypothetical protein
MKKLEGGTSATPWEGRSDYSYVPRRCTRNLPVMRERIRLLYLGEGLATLG